MYSCFAEIHTFKPKGYGQFYFYLSGWSMGEVGTKPEVSSLVRLQNKFTQWLSFCTLFDFYVDCYHEGGWGEFQ